MNLAVVLQLPAIFCSRTMATARAPAAWVCGGLQGYRQSRWAAFGMPALKVDGADIFAVYEKPAGRR
ncbi:MAG: hypothetical protein R3E50_13990 [Halioglobus sp.]